MVGLLNESLINNVIALKEDCVRSNPQCVVQITGGTEYWSHGSGGAHRRFTAVDIQLTGDRGQVFSRFIESKPRASRNLYSICRATYEHRGLLFCNENGSHWHVELKSGGGGTGTQTGNATLYVFPGLNIAGLVRNTSKALTPAQIQSRINAPGMKDLRNDIYSAARREGIDPKLFYALIAQESSGNPNAISPRGACGLTQILPRTARELGLTGTDTEICNRLRTDNAKALELGAKYLKQKITTGGDTKNGLAAYNGGNTGALGNSSNCPGRKRWECPWESGTAQENNLCYNQSRPTVPLRTDCTLNEDRTDGSYHETRFYVINILAMRDAVQ